MKAPDMSDRPTHLVIVTHAGRQGIDLFSAHYTESAARVMHGRLAALLAKTGSAAHMIEVPETEGVVEASATVEVAPAQLDPAPPVVAVPHKPVSRAKFAEEARRLAEAEASGIVTDTPMPEYSGAFS
jgi:hypothetical protein